MARIRLLKKLRRDLGLHHQQNHFASLVKRVSVKRLVLIGIIASMVSAFIALHAIDRALEDPYSIPSNKLLSSPGEMFLQDVRAQTPHTLHTSAHAYDFVHQYVTNGGNIYALFDFVNAHPELAFLKEAEDIYPEVFEELHARRLLHTYSDRGLYAYLAYLETLEKHGYDDITIQGELAFQYSKFGYYQEMIREDKRNGNSLNYPDYAQEETDALIEKARHYVTTADTRAEIILSDTVLYPDISTHQAFDSLVAYASALRFLEAVDPSLSVTPTADAVFAFAEAYGAKTHLADVYLPVYLKNASTQILLEDPDTTQLRAALLPFFGTDQKIESLSFAKKIFAARRSPSISRFSDLNILSYKNIQTLGILVPEFKAWLIKNGWSERDFPPASNESVL